MHKNERMYGRAGISIPAWIVFEAPVLCAAIQESGLLLFTYGDANNEECNVDIQLAHKVKEQGTSGGLEQTALAHA